MAANITIIRAAVRIDLDDAGAAIWTNAELDRHIQRAVLEYSLHVPLEQLDTLITTAGDRTIDVSTLTNRIAIEAVEYPTGQFPPSRVAFSLWQDNLTMDLVSPPAGAENVDVFWTSTHTIDGSGSTILAHHDELLTIGAAGYAAMDQAAGTINRLNTGGPGVAATYADFSRERIAYFNSELARLGRRNTVTVRRLYSTDVPTRFEQGRVKY